MKHYKNKKTGEVVKARLHQGEGWVEATQSEAELFDSEVEKRKSIISKKRYLFETSGLYSHDWTKAPEDVVIKRNKVLKELREIEKNE
jgi:hypothetical protein